MAKISRLRSSSVVADKSLTNTRLPDDVIINHVFSRLPVKSLMRFKSISKKWLVTITSPDFIETYNSYSRIQSDRCSMILYSRTSQQFLIVNTEGAVSTMCLGGGRRLVCSAISLDGRTFKPPPQQHPHLCFFICSNICNGLICVRNTKNHEVLLLNLTTRETKTLPLPDYSTKKGLQLPELKLGFDPVSRKYKVVFFYCDYTKWKVEVLTLGSKITRTTSSLNMKGRYNEKLLIHAIWTTPFSSLHPDGKFYWILIRNVKKLVYFDLASEKPGTIALPQSMLATTTSIPKIISLGGKMAIARIDVVADIGWLDCWVYDNNGDTTVWRKERWQLPKGVVAGGYFRVLGSLDGGEILLRTGSMFFGFDWKAGECRQIPIKLSLEVHSRYSFRGIVDTNIAPFSLLLQ